MPTHYGLQNKLKKEKVKKENVEASKKIEALTKENAELTKENTALKKQLEKKEASDDGKGTGSKNSSGSAGASKTK